MAKVVYLGGIGWILLLLSYTTLRGQHQVEAQMLVKAVEDRVTKLEQLNVSDRLARIEENQTLTRHLQYAELGGILSLAFEALRRTFQRKTQ